MKHILVSWVSKFYNRKKVICAKTAVIDKRSLFEGKNKIGSGSVIIDSTMGRGSYVGENTVLKHVRVGRYCSIAGKTQVIYGKHPVDSFVSTHPSFFSTNKQAGFTYVTENKYLERNYADKQEKRSVIIGNDVWIGDSAKLMEGVKIGNGAIVAAGSLVTNDVPPYAVVGGVPAKIIKYRFDGNVIKSLLESQWWNREEEWIEKHANDFADVQKFVEMCSEDE